MTETNDRARSLPMKERLQHSGQTIIVMLNNSESELTFGSKHSFFRSDCNKTCSKKYSKKGWLLHSYYTVITQLLYSYSILHVITVRMKCYYHLENCQT